MSYQSGYRAYQQRSGQSAYGRSAMSSRNHSSQALPEPFQNLVDRHPMLMFFGAVALGVWLAGASTPLLKSVANQAGNFTKAGLLALIAAKNTK